MPHATGAARNTKGGHKVIATFIIDGARRVLNGQLTGPAQEFTSTMATLQYNEAQALFGQQNFDGLLGPASAAFHFQNGVTISGPLDQPVHPASRVVGSGIWVLSA